MKKILPLILAVASIAIAKPASAQMSYGTSCRYWENGIENSVVPCTVKFSSDGYISWISTKYDTYYRGNGWALGNRNKECLRSTGGGYQIAVCPVTY
jgi:hypothetical protein